VTTGDQREPGTTARRAKALEMLAAGATVSDTAKAVGASKATVQNWQSIGRATILAAADERIGGIVDGAVEARRRLAEATPNAVAVVLELMDDDAPDPAAASVRLRAAITVLDRGGAPVLTKLEHSGEVVSDATLAKLRAALAAGRT